MCTVTPTRGVRSIVPTVNISACEEGNDSLVAKSNDCKSPVWMHFGFEVDGEASRRRVMQRSVSCARRRCWLKGATLPTCFHTKESIIPCSTRS